MFTAGQEPGGCQGLTRAQQTHAAKAYIIFPARSEYFLLLNHSPPPRCRIDPAIPNSTCCIPLSRAVWGWVQSSVPTQTPEQGCSLHVQPWLFPILPALPWRLGKPQHTHAAHSRLPAHFHLFPISWLIQPHNDSLLMDAAVFITCLN